ncbi:uncharacterized protein I206_101759 [Kwoniella pini CBS 10737]|uniref:Ketoreductase (KR) domain-containing protein n=1 Tax=Kwoniella pini CBS 10737 TaxID=1296096 RepID=A0A1B9HVS6_9TREE|nr:uncharacterized protein I206_06270 [Kwoniella pini CBS 10737]OCF47374.1 hypothetical protein I206_06270 [Kwoniella pini CBS 10737]
MMAAGFITNGAKVYITGRRKEILDNTVEELSEIRAKGGSIHSIQGDVLTKEGVIQIADAISEKEAIVDVLVKQRWSSKTLERPYTRS